MAHINNNNSGICNVRMAMRHESGRWEVQRGAVCGRGLVSNTCNNCCNYSLLLLSLIETIYAVFTSLPLCVCVCVCIYCVCLLYMCSRGTFVAVALYRSVPACSRLLLSLLKKCCHHLVRSALLWSSLVEQQQHRKHSNMCWPRSLALAYWL